MWRPSRKWKRARRFWLCHGGPECPGKELIKPGDEYVAANDQWERGARYCRACAERLGEG